MTKLEELARDCIENHTHRLVDKPTKQDIYLREESIFIQGYRQSEKRIADLEKENAELKVQIEKMKCCENCKHHCFWGNELNCRTLSYDEELECMKTRNKWELAD